MKERIVAVCSLMAGAAVVTLAAAIQRDPLTLTRAAEIKDSAPAQPSQTVFAAEAGMTRPIDTPLSPPIVELPPVRITGSLPRERTERPDAGALEPCSKWREIGPSTVVDGVPHDVRRVRLLCSSNGQPGEHLASDSSRAPS
jgi:hypothetical protein